LLLFVSTIFKTEAKPEDINLMLFLHAVSSDSAWSKCRGQTHTIPPASML